MAKSKLDEETSVEVPTTKIFVSAPRTKVFTFEQWARLRNKQERHMGGMKAFLGALVVNKYPLDVWDTKMASY